MSYSREEITDALFSRRNAGIKPGLTRMRAAAEKLGNPQDGYKVVHIAGTNGKGSTAAMMSAALLHTGERVGLFTSPHIIDFNERFIIDGKPVSDDEWIAVWLAIETVCDEFELTFFEISALMAFELFKRAGCSWAVIEVGLGGRLDATNIVTPEIALITALSVEHTEFLGDTIEEIAGEKLGIVKEGRPFIVNGANLPVSLELAKKRSLAQNAPLAIASPDDIEGYSYKEGKQKLSFHGREYTIPFLGNFQQSNAITVITALQKLGYDEKTIAEGVAKAKLPARMQQIVVDGERVIFDVAHNPQAMGILATSLKQIYRNEKIHFVVGMMKDKNILEALESIATAATKITAVSPNIPRAMKASEVMEIASEAGIVKDALFSAATVADGVKRALEEREGVVVVTGSFFTVSEAMVALEVSPY